MGVVGSISIRDNASTVLKQVRSEQTSLRRDAANTRKELQRTWDKKYTAKIDTSAAIKKTEGVFGKVKQLGKTVATPVIHAKDTASAKVSAVNDEIKIIDRETAEPEIIVRDSASGKITKVSSAIKTVGQKVAAPVIRAKDAASAKIAKVSSAIKAVGKKIASPVIRLKDSATTKINKVKSAIKGITKKAFSPVVKLKDVASAKISKLSGKLKAVGKVFTPVIKLKDAATKGLSSISSKVKKLAKATVIPVTAAVTIATAALTGAVSSGMQLENQQVSIEHFIGATNKDMDAAQVKAASQEYIEALRTNSNATPFETGEVIQAGARAVSISGGNTDEAMELVKLAEDMAAASGGTKSLSDAMEALADAKLGEMERLKEFGFKISAEEFDAKGFEGVSSDLNDFFGGAASKLAETGSGLLSTIKGKLKSSVADIGLGIVEKLKPTLTSAIALLDKAQPYFEKFGSVIADGIGKGIDAAGAVIPVFTSGLKSVFPVVEALVSGFKPLIPQLTAFGGGVVSTLQQVVGACLPAVNSIISTVQKVLPAILPAIQQVISTVGNLMAKSAPVIAGLTQAIGSAVSTLAPIFSKIFSEIGEKVGSVLSFVGERMGFIQNVISTAAPLIGNIISTAWSVISPVVDIAISVFEILFGVVQKVFPGIQSVVETVWSVVQPVVEGIGNVIGEIAGWFGSVADAITGSGGKSEAVGKNAKGDNNWKGGLTWVGEEGAELVDLPRGSRILPHKESVSFMNQRAGVVKESVAQVTQNNVYAGTTKDTMPVMTILGNITSSLKTLVDKVRDVEGAMKVPGTEKTATAKKSLKEKITVTIAKLADEIIVREDADIDEIADKVARKVVEVVVNMG